MALAKLWVKQYEPKTLDEIIFASPALRDIFKGYVKKKSIPNMLLIGAKGTGKSSISNALIHDLGVDPMDICRVPCSDDNIDTIRNRVKTFASTMPNGEFRVVQLEEMDGLSHASQKLLRTLIEDVSNTCRFICTANYMHLLIAPLSDSRLQVFEFKNPNLDGMLLRGAEILLEQNIKHDINTLEKVAEACYPDIRKFIQTLEKFSQSGELVITKTEEVGDWKLNLLGLLEKDDLKGARKLVCESASKEELVDVYRFLYTNIHRIKGISKHADQAVVLIAQYQYQHQFVADPEIQIAALFIELMGLL